MTADETTAPADGASSSKHLRYAAADLESYGRDLPPHYEAILHAALKGADYSSIAADLGIPTGTVKSRLHRARHALARLKARGEP